MLGATIKYYKVRVDNPQMLSSNSTFAVATQHEMIVARFIDNVDGQYGFPVTNILVNQ